MVVNDGSGIVYTHIKPGVLGAGGGRSAGWRRPESSDLTQFFPLAQRRFIISGASAPVISIVCGVAVERCGGCVSRKYRNECGVTG